ncbi:hypothetical protein BH18ACI2_BH18ACI2_24710 [soil metagenome]
MITYQKKFISIAEAWFGEEPTASGVDVVRCFQRAAPMSDALCREFHTILIELTQEPDELLAHMKRDNRYEIRRALTTDNLIYECWDANQSAMLAQFSDSYDEFAALKSLPKLDRRWLSLMADTGGLTLTTVKESAGDSLIWHVYYRSGSRATLLYSVSPSPFANNSAERNRRGRANRFHHWRDMLKFREEGATLYDLGGWYAGVEDRHRLNINRFKEEFGGDVITNYICERAMTLKGKLFLRTRQLLLGDAI